MTSMKISEINLLPVPTGLEQAVVAFDGVNKRITLNSIKSLVNKTDVGLSAVDNTADIDKPVSAAVNTALTGKADIAHLHAIANVINLQNTLDSKSDVSHSHSNYALTNHVHDLTGVTGLQAALDNKTDTGHTHAEHALTSHTHTVGNVTGLQAVLDNKTEVGHTHTEYSPFSHGHNIANVTGLQPALDGKSAVGHIHNTADISDLADYIAAQLAILVSTLSASGHTHQIADVVGLSNALLTKASQSDLTALSITVTALNTALANKADLGHEHTTSNITGLDAILQQFAAFQTQTNTDILDLQNFDLDVVTAGAIQW